MLKLLEENMDRTLQDTGVGKDFLNIRTDWSRIYGQQSIGKSI